MQIKIAERLKPFSHLPGTLLMLPGTTLALQIFPTLLRLYDLKGSAPLALGEVTFALRGPVRDFTMIQDLERKEIRVFGHSQEGYFRYRCSRNKLELIKGNLPLQFNTEALTQGVIETPSASSSTERLSLGSHKAQDWTLMKRRQNLGELLPLWFKLGIITPEVSKRGEKFSLLQACSNVIAKREKQSVLSSFLQLFLAGFQGIFVPRLYDDEYQGFATISPSPDLSSLTLLSEGARLIRSLFISQKGNEIAILPVLPAEFHAGRMLDIHCPSVGYLDVEWTKKQVRRLILRAVATTEVQFQFQPCIKEFRLKDSEEKKSARVSAGAPIPIILGREYYLDNFCH